MIPPPGTATPVASMILQAVEDIKDKTHPEYPDAASSATASEVIQRKSGFIHGIISEDILNLALVPVNPGDGNKEIMDCLEYLRLNGQYMEFLVQTVPLRAMEELYIEAGKIPHTVHGHVTGLKIYFGIKADSVTGGPMQQIFPIYQPLYMQREQSDVLGSTIYHALEDKYYVFESDVIRQITHAEADEYREHYRQQVTIKHYGENDFSDFRRDHDVEGVIFPFQTIFTLMHDNEVPEVYLYNAIRRKNNGQDGIWHCVLLLPEEMELFFGNGGILDGMYANRSRLCPPDCYIIRYNVQLMR